MRKLIKRLIWKETIEITKSDLIKVGAMWTNDVESTVATLLLCSECRVGDD